MSVYMVLMTAQAAVSTQITVSADSEPAAKAFALEMAKAGNVVWQYDGADDTTVEVESVNKQ